MAPWPPHHYRHEAASLGLPEEVVDEALHQAHRVQIRSHGRELPAILSLRHLSSHTNISYRYLRAVIYRNFDPYIVFTIPKRTGAPRRIHAPHPKLRQVQRWIHCAILRNIPAHPSAFGYAIGRSPIQCAEQHLNSRWIVKVDISNFFPSIDERQVFKVFSEAGYNTLVSFELARLCTVEPDHPTTKTPQVEPGNGQVQLPSQSAVLMNTLVPVEEHAVGESPTNFFNLALDPQLMVAPPTALPPESTEPRPPYPRGRCLGVLPQGAPTSPGLSNAVFRALDAELFVVAEGYGACYTRYADDLCFSTCSASFSRQMATRLLHDIVRRVTAFGYRINRRKTHIAGPGSRREVLGLLVHGSELLLRRETLRRIELHLHYLEADPIAHFNDRGFSSLDAFRLHIEGLVRYAVAVNPARYGDLLTRFESVHWPG